MRVHICVEHPMSHLFYVQNKKQKKNTQQQTNKNKRKFHSVKRIVSGEILRSLKKNVTLRKPLSALCSTVFFNNPHPPKKEHSKMSRHFAAV